MDDDGSKSLDYEEFKKGLHDYGVLLDETVIFLCSEVYEKFRITFMYM